MPKLNAPQVERVILVVLGVVLVASLAILVIRKSPGSEPTDPSHTILTEGDNAADSATE